MDISETVWCIDSLKDSGDPMKNIGVKKEPSYLSIAVVFPLLMFFIAALI